NKYFHDSLSLLLKLNNDMDEKGLNNWSLFTKFAPISMAIVNHKGDIIKYNDAFVNFFNSYETLRINHNLFDIISTESATDFKQYLNEITQKFIENPTKKFTNTPCDITVDASKELNVLIYAIPININDISDDKTNFQYIIYCVDTTDQKTLEASFAHSQKMQAVGQLAGGIAHDFNNLLTAMIGFCDLLLLRHPAGDQSFADIMQIKQNSTRAANLVRQLLAFSRKQTLQPKIINITDVLAELSNLVRRLIGENIDLSVIHGENIKNVKVDQGQLEQVIINLAVNARDAMSEAGGSLKIETMNVTIESPASLENDLIAPTAEGEITPGEYVRINVIDNGSGIPRKLLDKIFEPFFTTKAIGSGTGLGLSTVYGIINQTGGYIYVASEKDVGTKFSIFFKGHKKEKPKKQLENSSNKAAENLTGQGIVLLVEDEDPVRTFGAQALTNKGYEVLEASCGEEALDVVNQNGGNINVIITDVVMPGINGPTMIEEIYKSYPDIKVIFVSGYAEDAFISTYGNDRNFNFLAKPFTLKQLASKVKEVFNS
ncbi:MAG: response regulator, partial [Pseudomonadota bacterium]